MEVKVLQILIYLMINAQCFEKKKFIIYKYDICV